MNKYIDAEVINTIKPMCGVFTDEGFMIDYQRVISILENAPSIDICFCRECKHRGICFGRLVQGTEVVQLNFCSHGEREGER